MSQWSEYQAWVRSMWNWQDEVDPEDFRKNWSLRDDYLSATGLGGETGEVLEVLKKLERDHKARDDDFYEKLESELGDVLYYVTVIAAAHNISLASVVKTNIEKLEQRKAKRKAKKVVQDQETKATAVEGH